MPPVILDWIREFRHPDYTSIYELRPTEPKLYCTETLYGDWNGETLLLAKDAAPVHVIQARIGAGETDPWRHGQVGRDPMGGNTNRRVEELAGYFPGAKLYGSALAHLMKNTTATSGQLPGFHRGPLRSHLERVLEFVVGSMPNLAAIVCLGEEAWQLSCGLAGFDSPAAWPRGAGRRGRIAGRELTICRLYHPSRPFPGGWAARRREWQAAAGSLG